ncbi:MAG: T9SS type A sorting domain-containing protein, partial [Ignavibacteriaceae bacterium]|nr:T9SS type A sorting domain-containing protein [Ignavibacteriaceae bacterium]
AVSSDEVPVYQFSLDQNYPNPFNPSTKIKYSVPSVIASETKQSQLVTLKVYDILGNQVATLINEEKPSGEYEVDFDAAGLSSGIYFYKLQAGSFVATKKMILLR